MALLSRLRWRIRRVPCSCRWRPVTGQRRRRRWWRRCHRIASWPASLGCGDPLIDVELRLASDGALQVRTDRLALGVGGRISRIGGNRSGMPMAGGAPGIRASLTPGLQIAGRIDGAIHSGGETVFPEQLEERLMAAIQAASLPVTPCCFLVWTIRSGGSGWWPSLAALTLRCCSGLEPSHCPGRRRRRRGVGCCAPTWPPRRWGNGSASAGGSG